MHKILKYVYESGHTILYILGILLITIVMMFTFSKFANNFMSTPKTIQATVVAKNVDKNINPLKDNKFSVLLKTDDDKMAEFDINKREFNLLENKEQYIFQVDNNKVLYAVVSTQNEFIKTNKLEEKNIQISNEDVEVAKSLGYEVDKTIVAVDEPKDNQEDIEQQPEDDVTQNEENNNDNNDEDTTKEPMDNDNSEENDDTISNEEPILKKILATRENSQLKISIDNNSDGNYKTSLLFENNSEEYSCDNLPKDIGTCETNDKSQIITINDLKEKVFVIVKLYSDNISDSSLLGVNTEYIDL